MKKLSYIYMVPAILMMAACSENVADETAQGGDIQLCATVGELHADSRAIADPYLPQNETTLTADVWFRYDGSGYDDSPSAPTYLPVHKTVTFEGTPMMAYVTHNSQPLKYPHDNSTVYCVGMYPASGWTASADNATVTHAIDGETDLLFAPEISGSWASRFPTQQYVHLLTWIKINICASSHEAIDAWGTINQITVNSDSEVAVNLMTGEYTYRGTEQHIETMSESKKLSTTTHEVGSVFCSPKTEYTVTVNYTDKHGDNLTKTVPLSLNLIDVENDDAVTDVTDESQARGKCFVFSLYFTPYDVIEGVCTLNSWSDQSEDIYFNEEN